MLTLRSWLSIGTLDDLRNPKALARGAIGAILLLDNPNGALVPTITYLDLTAPVGQRITPDAVAHALAFINDQRDNGAHILLVDSPRLGQATALASAAIKLRGGGTLIEAYKSLWPDTPTDSPNGDMWEAVHDYYPDEPSFDVLWYHINGLTQHTTYPTESTRFAQATFAR